MTLLALIFWLIIALLVCGAVLGLVRAVLATPLFANVQPYANVIYALIVLLLMLWVVQIFTGFAGVPLFRPLVR